MNIKILLTSSGGGLGPEFLRLSKKIKKFKVINYAVDSNNNAESKYFSDYFDHKESMTFIISRIFLKKFNVLLNGIYWWESF